MRQYHYVVDREGRIFHDGTEIVDPLTLRFFLRVMTRTPDGRWRVVCQGEENWFAADDTPLVVQRLRLTHDGDTLSAVELVFAGDYREPLDPRTLESENGRLFCAIRGDALRACFGRLAMQQIAPYLTADGDAATLGVGDARFPIRARGELVDSPDIVNQRDVRRDSEPIVPLPSRALCG